MTTYGLERLNLGHIVGFASDGVPHYLQRGREPGSLVVSGDGFQVDLPSVIVDAIREYANDQIIVAEVVDTVDQAVHPDYNVFGDGV